MHDLIKSWILNRVEGGEFTGNVKDFAELLHSEIELRGYWDSALESIDDSDFALKVIKGTPSMDDIVAYCMSARHAAEMIMDEYATEALEELQGESIEEHNATENMFRDRKSADHINGEN